MGKDIIIMVASGWTITKSGVDALIPTLQNQLKDIPESVPIVIYALDNSCLRALNENGDLGIFTKFEVDKLSMWWGTSQSSHPILPPQQHIGRAGQTNCDLPQPPHSDPGRLSEVLPCAVLQGHLTLRIRTSADTMRWLWRLVRNS
jgi:hypothetical protein